MKSALLLLFSAAALAQSPAIANVALHDTKAAVQSKLKSHAIFQREEEGQQIFEFYSGAIRNLIVGYDDQNKVRYVTALGVNVPCEPLGTEPKMFGKPPDLTFQRELAGVVVIAHGASISHLTSCSLKDPLARMEDPDEKDEHR
jgi:hypothetical protein